VAQEVAPFNIEFTIVEPGPTKTNFGAGLVSPPPMKVYEHTPSGEMRRAMAAGAFALKGDAIKMVQAMIDPVGFHPAPKRLALGSSAYTSIRAALLDRLAALDAQQHIARSTDIDGYARRAYPSLITPACYTPQPLVSSVRAVVPSIPNALVYAPS
jgi:NAD(P)-dependent dehydrogenase (short-subunit alcohol dehydrogenase family)